MSPTGRAAQVRSDSLHCDTPATTGEIAREFLSIDYSSVTAAAGDEQVDPLTKIVIESAEAGILNHLTATSAGSVDLDPPPPMVRSPEQ